MASDIQKLNANHHLSRIIAEYRNQHVMPAVGAGLVIDNELVCSHVSGVRQYGTNHQTQPDDLFNIASITKPMTGYLVARLIDKGNVTAWDLTIGMIYPQIIQKLKDLSWINHYRDTTVTDLMTHASGIDGAKLATEEALGAADNPPGSTPHKNLIKKRKLHTEYALQDQPYGGWRAFGGCVLLKYSTGVVIVASMLEKVLGVSWEDLMKKYVFEPLGITHYVFGPMSSFTSVTNTRVHQVENGQIKSIVFPNASKHFAWTNSPAGAVGISVGDFAKWIAAILTNSKGFLSSTTWTEYVSPLPDRENTRGGWFVRSDGRISHNGSIGWARADCILDINKRLGAFAFTNIDSEKVASLISTLCVELTAMGEVLYAVGLLHQAIDFNLVNATADSEVDDFGAPLVSDGFFHTRWESQSNTPILTAALDQPRMLKGVILCQAVEPRIQSFDIEIDSGQPNTMPQTMSWLTLQQQTNSLADGLIIRTFFDAPVQAKSLKIKVNTASDPPMISRLLVLEYLWTQAVDFDISKDGRLWVIGANSHVLSGQDTIDENFIVLSHIPGQYATLIRAGALPLYTLAADMLVRKSTNAGFTVISGPEFVPCKRIALDKVKNTVWASDMLDGIRHYDGSKWVEYTAKAQVKDICVRDAIPYIVSTDDFVYQGISSGWQKLPGSSPKMDRIAVDEDSGKLWAITVGHQIVSYNAATHAWAQHAGNTLGKAITLHNGIPYIISLDGAIFKSTGTDWKKLNVLQDKTI